MDPLNLLTLILVWAAVGLFLWYLFTKIIPKNFLTLFGMGILLTLIFASFLFPTDETVGTIWRILSFPLTPLGAVITILALSFKQVSFKEGFKNNGQYVAIALAILFISSLPIFARLLVNRAEDAVRQAYELQQGICQDVCPADIPSSAPLSQVAGIVVLGENMDILNSPFEPYSQPERGAEGNPYVDLSPTLLTRLNSASRLYQRVRDNGAAPFVLVTMGPVYGGSEERTQKEQLIRQILAANGVPSDETLVINNNGLNARATMADVREILEDRGQLDGDDTLQINSNRVVLVAPALAMRRAALTFEQGDLQVVAWPTNFYGSAISTEDTLVFLSDLIPSVEALRLTTAYWNEFLTTIYYFLRGWLPKISVRWSEIVELVPE